MAKTNVHSPRGHSLRPRNPPKGGASFAPPPLRTDGCWGHGNHRSDSDVVFTRFTSMFGASTPGHRVRRSSDSDHAGCQGLDTTRIPDSPKGSEHCRKPDVHSSGNCRKHQAHQLVLPLEPAKVHKGVMGIGRNDPTVHHCVLSF